MMDADNQDLVRELDPFGFLIGHASAIKPLGGPERGPDPRYAFHTPYVPFRPGRVVFSIKLDRVQATFGELRVNINAFVPGSGRDAIFVTSSRVQLGDKAAVQRGMTLSIMAVAGATYAAYGFCVDGTDARAEAIRITAEEIDGGEETGEAQLLPTSFGDRHVETPIRLVDNGVPTLQDPVSQPMTESQLDEAAFGRWAAALNLRNGDPRRAWPLAFVAQTLDRYAMLRAGARGLGLGREAAALRPVMTASGCDASVAAIPTGDEDFPIMWTALPCSPIDAEPGADGLLPGAPLSLADEAPEHRGFDFLWSIGVAGDRYRMGDFASFMMEAMGPLRPSGYAVHMFDMATREDAPAEAVPRREIERIAVTLISRNFSVAQLNFGGDASLEQPSVPFGLIVRKG